MADSVQAGRLQYRHKLDCHNTDQQTAGSPEGRGQGHITPTPRELHWLPVHDRIIRKLLGVTYRSVHENLPLYLSQLIPPYTTQSRSLRSASGLFSGPRTVEQSDTASEHSDYLPFPMECPARVHSGRIADSILSFRFTLRTYFFHCRS